MSATQDPEAIASPTTAGASAEGPAVVERSIPTDVSAAWELELLIAGAVTFALFQLPSSIDAAREWGTGRVSGVGGFVGLMLGYVYAKSVLYVLIAAFVTNLAARSYWVGLVGLHSVYPGGVRWSALRLGPVTAERYRTRIRSLPSIIARVDNFASVIFSFAFLVVVTSVVSVAAFALFGLVAWGLAAALFGGEHVMALIYGLAALVVVPGLVAVAVDRRMGPTLDRGGPGWRRLDALVRVVSISNGTALFGPILFTLMSNAGRRRVMTVFYVALFGALGIAMTEWFVRMDLVRRGAPAFVPDDPDVQGVDGAHYESLRAPRPGDATATIQSDVIDGPYVRLFIPYRDERHDQAIRAQCPGVGPLRAPRLHLAAGDEHPARTDSAAARVLACLARISAVTLDGAPQPALAFRFYEHPQSEAPGILAYLPTAGLAPGMHTITIAPLPRLPGASAKRPLVPTVIPFWR